MYGSCRDDRRASCPRLQLAIVLYSPSWSGTRGYGSYGRAQGRRGWASARMGALADLLVRVVVVTASCGLGARGGVAISRRRPELSSAMTQCSGQHTFVHREGQRERTFATCLTCMNPHTTAACLECAPAARHRNPWASPGLCHRVVVNIPQVAGGNAIGRVRDLNRPFTAGPPRSGDIYGLTNRGSVILTSSRSRAPSERHPSTSPVEPSLRSLRTETS